MSAMATAKIRQDVLKNVVAQICQTIGFQTIQSSSLDILTDLLHRYLKDMAVTIHRYSEHCGRTLPSLEDLTLTFRELGINITELEEYMNYVEPVNLPYTVPRFPVPKSSNLNFLKPGSREIVSRALYVHEHLPPMYPEKEEGNLDLQNEIPEVLNGIDDQFKSVSPSPNSKHSTETDASSPLKKLKSGPDEEGENIREIDSVMMTTSGYISSAREGKMPEAKRPDIPFSFPRSKSPNSRTNSLIKKKVTMEKIIRHKNHQEGILPGHLAKPKSKHHKLKPKISSARPGTGSLDHSHAFSQPKLKIPKESDDSPFHNDNEIKKKKKKDREGRPKKVRDDDKDYEVGKKVKEVKMKEHRKLGFGFKRDNRMRIRMRGLSKEEELRRYKERENELLAALAASANLNVTALPAPALRVRESNQTSPKKASPSKMIKARKADFKKHHSSVVKMEAPNEHTLVSIKEEKPSPPSSPREYYSQNNLLSPPRLATPSSTHSSTHLPIKIKSETVLCGPSSEDLSFDSHYESPNWTTTSLERTPDPPKTPEDNLGIGSSQPPSLYNLPSFPSGPSLIPPPMSSFPFIPPYGANPRPPTPEKHQNNLNKNSPDDSNSHDHSSTPKIKERLSSRSNRSPVRSESLETSHSTPAAVKNSKKNSSKSSKLKTDKEKKKEHKEKKKEKEKKEKERMKKKREKEKAREEKKKLKKEQKEKLKKEMKEKLKREKKLKSENNSEGLPKITLKLQTETEETTTLEESLDNSKKSLPKVFIKPVVKQAFEGESYSERPKKKPRIVSPSPPSPSSPVSSFEEENPSSSPQIAKFSPLITRPPKGSQSKKSSENLTVPTLTIKQEPGLKITSKKDKEASPHISTTKGEYKDSVVPPLKIKNSSSVSGSSPSVVRHSDEKTPNVSKRMEKKEKRKTAPLVITSLGTVDAEEVRPPPGISPPAQLPPPIRIPPEMPKTSKKGPSSGSSSGTKSTSSGLLTETVGPIGHFVDDQGNEVWICPTCGKQDDGSPMIGCDTCDDWYHWLCVGIHVPPSERENWYCPRCISQHKHQRVGVVLEKKKRGRKRKNMD